ncbi:MAG: DUF669 domain-containing protein [Clostridiales bacterium]
MGIWAKFDDEFDVEQLKKDIEESKSGGDYPEIPHGEYEVKVEKIQPKTSKNGNPMLSIWFKILVGEFKGNIIFYNQVLSKGFGVGKALEFLDSLESGIPISFNGFDDFEDMLMDIAEAIDGELEYALNYSEGKNGFSDYEITEVFEV